MAIVVQEKRVVIRGFGPAGLIKKLKDQIEPALSLPIKLNVFSLLTIINLAGRYPRLNDNTVEDLAKFLFCLKMGKEKIEFEFYCGQDLLEALERQEKPVRFILGRRQSFQLRDYTAPPKGYDIFYELEISQLPV